MSHRVTGCSASFNGNFGILFSSAPWGQTLTGLHDVVISNCVVNSNGGATAGSTVFAHSAGGIYIDRGQYNVLIKDCQVESTFSTNGVNGKAVGIYASLTNNIVIEDTNIFNTTSTTATAHGIMFDTVADSKIIRTQLHRNKNAGVELVGTNTTIDIIECISKSNDIGFEFAAGSTASCCLVQDSRAIKNTTSGFVYAAALPLTTTFIGNEAQCQGANNYVGLTGLINLQSLSWTNGVIANVNGGAAPGARFTNISAGP